MDEKKPVCPCKRVKCKRYGDCAACRVYHETVKGKPPACERVSGNKLRKAKQGEAILAFDTGFSERSSDEIYKNAGLR